MATEIRVPTLGESVTEATVGQWFKKVGDAVAADEPLVELETDKVTLEVPAPAAGVLEAIAVKDGETVGVGALLGTIAAERRGAAEPRRPRPDRQDRSRDRADRRRTRGRSTAADGRAAPPEPPSSPRSGDAAGARRRASSLAEKSIDRRPASPAPARTAASPRATCWPRSPAAAQPRRPRRRPQVARARRRPTTPRARSACA